MLSILNLITESSKYQSPWYGTLEKSKIAENISFNGIGDGSKKITLPVTFIEQKSGQGQFWKRVKNGNEKQLQTLEDLKSNPSFLKNGFNDTTLKQIFDEWGYKDAHIPFKEFKNNFHFIEIAISELGHSIVRYSPEKDLSDMSDTIEFFKSK